jgi:glutamine amidotransferase
MKLVILNLGIGNIGSLRTMLCNLGVDFKESIDINELIEATHIIFPGVGAYSEISALLYQKVDVDALKLHFNTSNSVRFLGICIGMQLLSEIGLEGGESKGMGLLDGTVENLKHKLEQDTRLPHVGWNNIEGCIDEFKKFENRDFYFVHNYYFNAKREHDVAAWVNYGGIFPAIVKKKNIIGVQFHPEKSQSNGIDFIRAFLNDEL